MEELTTEAIARWDAIDTVWQLAALTHSDYEFYNSFEDILELGDPTSVFYMQDEDLAWMINDMCDIAEHTQHEAEKG